MRKDATTMFTRPLRTALFLLALTVPGVTPAASLPAPRVGQEWTYTGSIHITGAQRADHTYTTTATVVGPAEVARFRRAGNTPFLPAASLAWLTPGREAKAH